MSKQKHSESGRHRNERREHDREAREYEENVYTGPAPHISKGARYAGLAVVVIVIIGITVLFMGGVIRW